MSLFKQPMIPNGEKLSLKLICLQATDSTRVGLYSRSRLLAQLPRKRKQQREVGGVRRAGPPILSNPNLSTFYLPARYYLLHTYLGCRYLPPTCQNKNYTHNTMHYLLIVLSIGYIGTTQWIGTYLLLPILRPKPGLPYRYLHVQIVVVSAD